MRSLLGNKSGQLNHMMVIRIELHHQNITVIRDRIIICNLHTHLQTHLIAITINMVMEIEIRAVINMKINIEIEIRKGMNKTIVVITETGNTTAHIVVHPHASIVVIMEIGVDFSTQQNWNRYNVVMVTEIINMEVLIEDISRETLVVLIQVDIKITDISHTLTHMTNIFIMSPKVKIYLIDQI